MFSCLSEETEYLRSVRAEVNPLLYVVQAPQSHNQQKSLVENFQMQKPNTAVNNSFISFLPEVIVQGVYFDLYHTMRFLNAVRITPMLFSIER